MNRRAPLEFGLVIKEVKKILKERPPPLHDEVRDRIGQRIRKIKNADGLMIFLTTNIHFRELYLLFGSGILEGLGIVSSAKPQGQTTKEVWWLLLDGLGHLIRLEGGGWRLTACDQYTPAGRVVAVDEVKNPCRRCKAML